MPGSAYDHSLQSGVSVMRELMDQLGVAKATFVIRIRHRESYWLGRTIRKMTGMNL